MTIDQEDWKRLKKKEQQVLEHNNSAGGNFKGGGEGGLESVCSVTTAGRRKGNLPVETKNIISKSSDNP